MAGLARALPEIELRGGGLVVVGPARFEHIPGFREVTGYTGLLFTDPSLRTFRAAGLAYGWSKTFHPLTFLKGISAVAKGFRQGIRRGDVAQQGGTFVLGPGERVHFEWRDRFAGDLPDLDEVLKALG